MDIPVVTYDREKQTIYLENSDGTRTEIGKRMRKGRYSERVAEKDRNDRVCGSQRFGKKYIYRIVKAAD